MRAEEWKEGAASQLGLSCALRRRCGSWSLTCCAMPPRQSAPRRSAPPPAAPCRRPRRSRSRPPKPRWAPRARGRCPRSHDAPALQCRPHCYNAPRAAARLLLRPAPCPPRRRSAEAPHVGVRGVLHCGVLRLAVRHGGEREAVARARVRRGSNLALAPPVGDNLVRLRRQALLRVAVPQQHRRAQLRPARGPARASARSSSGRSAQQHRRHATQLRRAITGCPSAASCIAGSGVSTCLAGHGAARVSRSLGRVLLARRIRASACAHQIVSLPPSAAVHMTSWCLLKRATAAMPTGAEASARCGAAPPGCCGPTGVPAASAPAPGCSRTRTFWP